MPGGDGMRELGLWGASEQLVKLLLCCPLENKWALGQFFFFSTIYYYPHCPRNVLLQSSQSNESVSM